MLRSRNVPETLWLQACYFAAKHMSPPPIYLTLKLLLRYCTGLLAHGHVYGVVTGGARGVWGSFRGGLGLAVAVCGAHLDGVIAWSGFPVVDVLPPCIFGELFCEAGCVPGLSTVCRDLNLLDTAVWGPGDTAYRVLACGEVVAGADGVDTGLGLDGAFLRPGALDPVRVEVPARELYLGEPLGGRDVSVEAMDDEPDGVAVLYGELAAVQAEGDQGVTPVQRDVRLEAGRKAVDAAAHELSGGSSDLISAQAGLREDVGEQHPGPASVGDEPAADGVGDAGERYVRLAGGHIEKVLVGKLYRVVNRALYRERPIVHVYPRRTERGVYQVEGARRRNELRHAGHIYGGIRRRLGRRLVRRGLSGALVRLTLPCRLFLVRRFREVQLLGPGRALDGSITEQSSHTSGRETCNCRAAAEQQESASPDGHPAVRSGLPRPHDGRGRTARLAHKGRPFGGYYCGAEARRAQQKFGDSGTGEEGDCDRDHRRRRGHEGICQGCYNGYDGEDGDAGERERRVSYGEVAEEEGDRHGT